MSDEEKALEIANNIVQKLSDRFGVEEWNEFSKTDLIIAALEAMDWKNKDLVEQHRIIKNHWQKWAEEQKQEIIERAVDFIKKAFYVGINNQVTSIENYHALPDLIRDFKEVIEGDLNHGTDYSKETT